MRPTSPIDHATTVARARYDRIAALYDFLEAPMERGRFSTWRQCLWAQGKGPRVLEVGVGTGKNFPYQGLREIRRVVKTSGRIYLLEHVRPPGLAGYVADLLNPLVVCVYGANINRCTVENVQRAGLAIDRVENLWDDVLKLVIARPGK